MWELIADKKAVTLSANCSGVKFALPIVAWILPVLSSLNSNLPFLISETAPTRSIATVPALGFGIKPFGPSAFATFARSFMRSGEVTKTSKFIFPFSISAKRSDDPTISAPAFFTSSILSSEVYTATFTVLPFPCGRDVVALMTWSLYLGFANVFTAISIDGINLV